MPRPQLPPVLVPWQPRTVLGWAMQKTREVDGEEQKTTTRAFGCSPAHLSRVEHGSIPSRELVNFYDQRFESQGLLASMFEVALHANEAERRRGGGQRLQCAPRALPGDASTFVSDTVPHGSLMAPGQFFTKPWCIRNSGAVPWTGRMLERQGPLVGPGLISSAPRYVVPDTEPGQEATIQAVLKAPTYDCSSRAYFKMIGTDGQLCFPNRYSLGLDVLVMVRGQLPDRPLT